MDKKYVVSYELSVKLKELCVPQIGEIDWYKHGGEIESLSELEYTFCSDNSNVKYERMCSAFMTDELLEMLPHGVNNYYFLSVSKGIVNGYYVNYSYFNEKEDYVHNVDGNDGLPNALARMLVWCIENGHVNVSGLERDVD